MTDPPATPPLLLVVDDDPSILLLIDVIAERLGFKVKAAISGLQALKQLRDGLRPNVILLDLMMERIDGVTSLVHLKEMSDFATTPVVAMSTEAVDGTLIKPLTRHSLASCLERYLPART